MTGRPDDDAPDPRPEAVREVMDDPQDVDLPEGWDVPRTPLPDTAPEDGPPPEADCADYPLNDLGNARRLVRHFGADMMFVPRVGWFVWDGQRWKKDEDELAVRARAQRLGPLIEAEVPFMRPPPQAEAAMRTRAEAKRRLREIDDLPADERAALDDEAARLSARVIAAEKQLQGWEKTVARRMTWAKDAGNSGRLKNAAIEAQTLRAVPFDSLDAEEWAVCCESGVLRFSVLPKGGPGEDAVARVDLHPHDRADRITKLIGAAWAPGAPAPRWRAFLERVQPDPAMRAFLARWVGLCLTAHTGEQKLAFHYGTGANGKSVFSDTLARVLADYAATAKIESITGQNRRGGAEATPDLVPLIGARFVRASEPEEGERFQEALIKALTGGEEILVRPLNKDFVAVKPVFKLNISGNHKPEIRGGDEGIWRRVMLVPWEVTIPAAERDPDLGAKLWAERDGIFAWAVAGLLDYLEQGLCPPDSIAEATAEYRAESDPLGEFLADCCVVTGEAAHRVMSAELGAAFNFWRRANGQSEWGATTVAKRFSDRSRVYVSPGTGARFQKHKSAGLSSYVGLRLNDTFGKRFAEAPRDAQGRPIVRSEERGEVSDPGGTW